MDEKLRKAVEERAYALWEQAGRPEGSELAYWFQAEGEIIGLSVAGEEDPMVAVDDFPPGEALNSGDAAGKEAALQANVEQAVPAAEQLPSGEAENPISKRIKGAAKGRSRAKR